MLSLCAATYVAGAGQSSVSFPGDSKLQAVTNIPSVNKVFVYPQRLLSDFPPGSGQQTVCVWFKAKLEQTTCV